MLVNSNYLYGNTYYYRQLNQLTQKHALSFDKSYNNITLSKEAIYSCGSPLTGETASVYYDESSTSLNPVMLVKGKDTMGNDYEIKVQPEEVDPEKANYIELLALSSYLKGEGKFSSVHPGIEPSLCEHNSYFVKQDYIESLKWLRNCQWVNGNMDGYTYLTERINHFISYPLK